MVGMALHIDQHAHETRGAPLGSVLVLSARQRSGVTMSVQTERIVYTVEEAAERLGVGRTLVYALVRSGDIESIAIGRLRRIPCDALDDFVDRMRQIGREAHDVEA